jgi:hypothetical protein
LVVVRFLLVALEARKRASQLVCLSPAHSLQISVSEYMKKRHADGGAPADASRAKTRPGDCSTDAQNAWSPDSTSSSQLPQKRKDGEATTTTPAPMDIDSEIRSLPYRPSLSSLPIKNVDGTFQLTGPMFDPSGLYAKSEDQHIDYRCDDEIKTLELGRHLGVIA